MHIFAAVITALMLLPLSLNAEEKNNGSVVINNKPEIKDIVKTEKAAPRTPRLLNDILPSLTQILILVGNERFSSKKLTVRQKYDILHKLVISLNPYMDLKMAKPFPALKKKVKSFPVSKLKQNKILCFRIDSFASENIKAFTDAAQEICKTKKKPDGIIIDLRNCSGFNNKNMLNISRLCKSLELTIVCFVGKYTSGDAELLAQIIASLPKGIIMGKNTAGKPFDYKVVELKSGFILMIPKIPAYLKKLPEKTVKPSIYCKDSSACMNAAVDLLSVVKIH